MSANPVRSLSLQLVCARPRQSERCGHGQQRNAGVTVRVRAHECPRAAILPQRFIPHKLGASPPANSAPRAARRSSAQPRQHGRAVRAPCVESGGLSPRPVCVRALRSAAGPRRLRRCAAAGRKSTAACACVWRRGLSELPASSAAVCSESLDPQPLPAPAAAHACSAAARERSACCTPREALRRSSAGPGTQRTVVRLAPHAARRGRTSSAAATPSWSELRTAAAAAARTRRTAASAVRATAQPWRLRPATTSGARTCCTRWPRCRRRVDGGLAPARARPAALSGRCTLRFAHIGCRAPAPLPATPTGGSGSGAAVLLRSLQPWRSCWLPLPL